LAYPDTYSVTYSYTDFSAGQGDSSFPGAQIDADLAGLQASIENVDTFVQQVIRSDGALANGIVTYDALSPGLQTAGLAPASDWATGTAYAAEAPAIKDGSLYRAASAHTSGIWAVDLAAGKWTLVTALPVGPAGPSGDGTGDMLKAQNLNDVASKPTALSNLGALPTAGGTMTGALTLAGAPTSDNHAATKAYVDAGAAGSPWDSGDARLTFRQTAKAGWIFLNDGSIGDASSGATTRANDDTAALFAVFYSLPIALTVQNSSGVTVSRGASAAADFAAHRRIVAPRTLGRVLGVAGVGSGLTSRAVGAIVGAETHLLITAETPKHSHTGGGTSTSGVMSANATHNHSITVGAGGVIITSGAGWGNAAGGNVYNAAGGVSIDNTNTDHTHTVSYSFTTSEIGGDGAHNNMQPTTFLNLEVKL
jgi:microcystin-dependent protein